MSEFVYIKSIKSEGFLSTKGESMIYFDERIKIRILNQYKPLCHIFMSQSGVTKINVNAISKTKMQE